MPDFALDIAALRRIAGLSLTSNFLGDTDSQTATNKIIDAASNTIQNVLVLPALKQIGIMLSPNLSTGFGVFQPVSATGTIAAGVDTTNGMYARVDTGTTQNTLSGSRTNIGGGTTVINFNPVLTFKFRTNQTDTNFRSFIGFRSTSAIPNSDDPLSSVTGFGIARITTNANWQFVQNNGTAGSHITSTGVAIDTAVHKVVLTADFANSRTGYSFDGAATTYDTTQPPASGTAMSWVFGLVNSGVAASKTQDHFYSYMVADK
jgi:hypothetical protein